MLPSWLPLPPGGLWWVGFRLITLGRLGKLRPQLKGWTVKYQRAVQLNAQTNALISLTSFRQSSKIRASGNNQILKTMMGKLKNEEKHRHFFKIQFHLFNWHWLFSFPSQLKSNFLNLFFVTLQAYYSAYPICTVPTIEHKSVATTTRPPSYMLWHRRAVSRTQIMLY